MVVPIDMPQSHENCIHKFFHPFRIYGLNLPFLLFILMVILALTYSNHFQNEFHFDDFHVIVDNVYIKSLKNIPLFFTDAKMFSSLPSNQTYRPVVSATFSIDYWLGNGLNPFYFHLTTFISFLLQGLLDRKSVV